MEPLKIYRFHEFYKLRTAKGWEYKPHFNTCARIRKAFSEGRPVYLDGSLITEVPDPT
jgi:hypothetical protein